jgi:hypothetical protein
MLSSTPAEWSISIRQMLSELHPQFVRAATSDNSGDPKAMMPYRVLAVSN